MAPSAAASATPDAAPSQVIASIAPTATPGQASTMPSPTPRALATARPSAAAATPTPSPSPSGMAGLIVPLYLHDGDPGWSALVAVKRAHPKLPILAVVNPADGVTRDTVPLLPEAVQRLDEVGVVTLGYVRTDYAARSENAINLELDRWRSQYPALKGIFFDEMASGEGAYPYYGALSYGAKRRGFGLTVGNVGVAPEAGVFASMDVVVVYENGGMPTEAATANRDHVAMLAHSVAALDPASVRAAAARYGYLYVTEDVMPNPWDTLSRYAEALAELLTAS
jgi:hypothetical protein